MIYGSQWSAIMDWMSKVTNPNAVDPDENLYIYDSTGMGHYCYDADDNRITDEIAPIKTGSNSAYSVKNIYDLAGNYYEWSQEASNGDSRVFCGCSFDYDGAGGPASDRGDELPYPNSDYNVSSRIQLYIK